MTILDKINIFSVVISVLIFGFLGFFVYFNNKKSATNRAFLLFTVIEIIWNITNYLSYQFYLSGFTIWLARLTIFFSVWLTFSVFNFIYLFPKEKPELGKIYKFILVPFVAIFSLLTLTPFVFNKVESIGNVGLKIANGPLIFLFGATVIGLIIAGMIILARRMIRVKAIEKSQYEFILTGTSITFILHIIFNFIFPSFLENLNFIPMGGVFSLPFLLLTIYAIFKHNLFNIKIIAVELLTFAIWITLLLRIFLSENQTNRIVGGLIFFAIVIFGLMLIKSVIKEVGQREKMQILTGQLESVNKRLKKMDQDKSEFLSIASHQLRTPMTVIKGYISMIMEGSFGKFQEKLSEVLNRIYISNERLVKIVDDLLDISRIERGKMIFSLKKQSFEKIISDIVQELKPLADQKKIKLVWEQKNKNIPEILIDESYMRQVILNLIDNAIKYSNDGSIVIDLEAKEKSLIFKETDSGMGISKEVMPFLFQRYSRGEHAYAKTAEGMGLGLYVARKIVEGHKGKIWAESEGEGKGSTFFVELPI